MLDLSDAIAELPPYATFDEIDLRVTAESIAQDVRLTRDQFVEETIKLCTALMRKDRVRVIWDAEAMPLAA